MAALRSARLVVFGFALLATVLGTWLTLSTRGVPPAPHRWPQTFLARLRAGLRASGRERASWLGALAYGGLVSVLHFGGLHFEVYVAIAQWDLLTHAMGGAGVALLLYLTFHQGNDGARPLRWILPAVLAIGAGFELYEYLCKSFWHAWSWQFYLEDTAVDLLVNAVGGGLAVAGLRVAGAAESF
jgi:hypothetical protein